MTREPSPPSQPVLLVLHGHDADAKHGDALARAVDPDGRFRHVAVQGPVAVDDGLWAWFEPGHVGRPGVLGPAATAVAEVVASLVADGGVDPADITVLGWSQGAAAALATLLHDDAPPFGRLVVISGFVAEDPARPLHPEVAAGVAVLSIHGTADDVVPSFFGDDVAALLAGAGAEVTEIRHASGHELPDDVAVAVASWLAR